CSNGDKDGGGSEAEKAQEKPLALPAAQEVLEHGDRTLPRVAAPGHLRVDRQGAEQGDDDEADGGDRGHRARCEQRDAGLVAERREIVDSRQPDDLPPGMGGDLMAAVAVQGLAARQPLPDGGSMFERALRRLMAKREALAPARRYRGGQRRATSTLMG